MTSGGKTETAWFDPNKDGVLLTGKAEAVKDKNGKTFAFCAETSGSLKGTGVTGEKEPAMRPLRSETESGRRMKRGGSRQRIR